MILFLFSFLSLSSASDHFLLVTLWSDVMPQSARSGLWTGAGFIHGVAFVCLSVLCALWDCAGLSLVVGLVLYISSINDEVMNRPREPEQFFNYHYGWSFAFAASSFLLKEVSLVLWVSPPRSFSPVLLHMLVSSVRACRSQVHPDLPPRPPHHSFLLSTSYMLNSSVPSITSSFSLPQLVFM